MKKLIFSLIGLVALTFSAFGQWSYLTTNLYTGPYGLFSNSVFKLCSASNAVWLIDELSFTRNPGVGTQVTNLALTIFDNNWSSNTSSAAYSKVSVSQYLTNEVYVSIPHNTAGIDPGAAGAVWTNVNNKLTNAQGGTVLWGSIMFRNNLTNWVTNTYMYTLQTTTSVTKATVLTPKWVSLLPTISAVATYTYSDLGIMVGKGCVLGAQSYDSNIITATIKYRELFSPARP